MRVTSGCLRNKSSTCLRRTLLWSWKRMNFFTSNGHIRWALSSSLSYPTLLILPQYSQSEALDLFESADLRVVDSWKAPSSDYRLYLLERPSVRFNTSSAVMREAAEHRGDIQLEKTKGVPKWDGWLDLWKLWDQSVQSAAPSHLLMTGLQYHSGYD
jgi:hypothetical protein